jgi:predicted transcriptional regulator
LSPAKAKSKSEIRLAFFELLFGTTEGFLCIACSDPKAPKIAFTQRFFEWPRESLKVEDYILKQEGKHNVYFCVNLLAERERKKTHCLPTDILWADLDETSPDSVSKIPPPIVVQSSPNRWQAFWRLTAKIEPYNAERYSRRIAYDIGADRSGWDLTQLLRVPLTHNFKYDPASFIKLERALTPKISVEVFEAALPAPPEEDPELSQELPTDVIDDPDEIIAKYRLHLNMDKFMVKYTHEPELHEDWSSNLWSLEVMCFNAGMKPEEVFVIAKNSACNKYARDSRPVEHLWHEVLKANDKFGVSKTPDKELLVMPELVNEPASEDTFIDTYMDWASEATDAIPEFHELSAFIVLSTIVAGSVRLQTSYGPIVPNIWGLVLGDSTITRKSTSMKMAIDLLTTMEPEVILATDGSVEGLLTGLSTRPNKVSVFFRDEVSGLFDSMVKRDYLSSMPETLAHLYDVPPVYSRLLRKEVIRIESPAFIFFGGGITERVYGNISESWIESGFLPRFMVVSGIFKQESLRPTGPPTESNIKKRSKIVNLLADLKETYADEVQIKVAGMPMSTNSRVTAELTTDAWARYQSIENTMTMAGYESLIRNTALPTFDRMARSILKMAIILGASRQRPNDDSIITIEESDVINAAWYAQKWGKYSVELVLNAGKAPREKYIQRVLRKIENEPGILRSRLMQHLHMDKREADSVISTLEERGQIRRDKSGRGERYTAIV